MVFSPVIICHRWGLYSGIARLLLYVASCHIVCLQEVLVFLHSSWLLAPAICCLHWSPLWRVILFSISAHYNFPVFFPALHLVLPSIFLVSIQFSLVSPPWLCWRSGYVGWMFWPCSALSGSLTVRTRWTPMPSAICCCILVGFGAVCLVLGLVYWHVGIIFVHKGLCEVWVLFFQSELFKWWLVGAYLAKSL